jgi:hypothetical protein
MRNSWIGMAGMALAGIMLAKAGAQAQTQGETENINIKGVIVDRDKVPVVGAKVKLRTLGREAISGNTGAFHITGTSHLKRNLDFGQPGMAKGQFRFSVGPEARTLTVSVFNPAGRKLVDRQFAVLGGAEYALNPEALVAGQPASGLYFITLRAGNFTQSFKTVSTGMGDPALAALSLRSSSPVSGLAGALAKRQAALAVIDTLDITHEDHKPQWLAIESYVLELDTLEMEENERLGRLLIADGVSNHLRSVDLNTGAVLDSFDIGASRASLYSTENGRFGFAIIGGVTGKIRVVHSGLYIEEHEDHIHREATAPKLLSFEWTGVKPVHYVSHHGWSAIHFDGDTAAAVNAKARMLFLNEGDLLKDSVGSFGSELSGPAHGVGLFGEGNKLLVTPPNPHYANRMPGVNSTPYGVKVYDRDFNVVQDFADTTEFEKSCRGLHGEASMGRYVLFGCNGVSDSGALLLTYDTTTQQYASKKIRYFKDGRGTGTVKSHGKQSVFIGNLGARHLARYKPSASALDSSDVVELDSAQAGFEFEKEHGEHLAVLTRSGKLHIFKPRNGWEKVKTVDLLTTGHWATGNLVPKLITGPGYAYVSDPHNGKIHEVRLHDGVVTRAISLGGQPWNMSAQGWYDAFGRDEGSHD